MPYASAKQRAFFHTATAKKKGITKATVDEFDAASKGMKLPERAAERAEPNEPPSMRSAPAHAMRGLAKAIGQGRGR